jgi:hypothetical protein
MILSLKKVFVVSVAVALLGVLGVYGMSLLSGREAASVESKVTSTLINGPLELRLELDKTEFVQGEPVNITVSLKNIGNKTITVVYTTFKTRVGVKILYLNGTIANEWGRSPLTATEEVSFAPGEQVSRTYVWDQDVVIFEGRTFIGRRQAPKGTYKIVGTTGTSIGVYGIGPLGMLETPPITITIK